MADFNKNELILERVRSLTYHDLATNKMLLRLTSLEDTSLQCTAESDEVVDGMGATITNIYKAKKATLSGSNSLMSLDLAAIQYGTEKEVASSTNKIVDYAYEILEISGGKVTLAHTPKDAIKYIYSIKDNGVGEAYTAGSQASAKEFLVAENTITVPTGLTGKVFVEYNYESEKAVKVRNSATKFPSAGSVIVYAYFKDPCNENLTYSGKIVCPKAKINPESMELALNSTGKHPFEFNMMKDYCSEDGDDELFSIIVAE